MLFPVKSAPEEGGRIYTIEAGNGEEVTLTLRSRDTGELASFINLYGDHDTNFMEDCEVVMPGDYTISASCGEITETVPLRVDLSTDSVLSLDTQYHVGITAVGHYDRPIRVEESGKYLFVCDTYLGSAEAQNVGAYLVEMGKDTITRRKLSSDKAGAEHIFELDLSAGTNYILQFGSDYSLEFQLKKAPIGLAGLEIDGKEKYDNVFSFFGDLTLGSGENFQLPKVTLKYEDGTKKMLDESDWTPVSEFTGHDVRLYTYYCINIRKNICLELRNEEDEVVAWPEYAYRPVGNCKYVVYAEGSDHEGLYAEKAVTIGIPSDIPELKMGINEKFCEIKYPSEIVVDATPPSRVYASFCPEQDGKYSFHISAGYSARVYQFDGKQLEEVTVSYNVYDGTMPSAVLQQGKMYILEIYDAESEGETVEVVREDEGSAAKKITQIKVLNPPKKTDYEEGEKFDPTGLKVVAVYQDGTEEELSDYTFAPAGALQPGDKEIVITYSEWKVSVPVTVNKKTVPDTNNKEVQQQSRAESDKETAKQKKQAKQEKKIKKTKVTIKKTKSTKKGTIQISWKKQKNITGYEIQLCTNKKFRKNVKKYRISKSGATSKKIKKLKKKRYFVRIRVYKVIDNKKCYGSWGKIQVVKVK